MFVWTCVFSTTEKFQTLWLGFPDGIIFVCFLITVIPVKHFENNILSSEPCDH